MVAALVAIVGSMGIAQQVRAEFGTDAFWMSITNTKTGTVKELKWDVSRYHFQKKILINIDDFTVEKIRQVFGKDRFEFNTLVRSYEAKWHHFNVAIGINRQLGTNLRIVFAVPDSNEKYLIQKDYKIVDFVTTDSAGSNPHSVKPATNSLKIFVNSDKQLYRQDEKAVFYIAFVDENDKFVDPDSIIVKMNLFPTGHTLEKKKIGSYTLVTPPLGRGNNQITVVAQKAMYNIDPSSIDITVLPRIPTAWYKA